MEAQVTAVEALEKIRQETERINQMIEHRRAFDGASLGGSHVLVPAGSLYVLAESRLRLAEALNWLVHLVHGVGKAGDPPDSDEWESAFEEAERALIEAGGGER